MMSINNRGFGVMFAFMLVWTVSCSSLEGQIQIGGPNGVVIGGGQGLRIGGFNGVQFGGGQGARFGPPNVGVQFGGGHGVRFGPTGQGLQFGGNQYDRWGRPIPMEGQFAPANSGNFPRYSNFNGRSQPAGQFGRKILYLPANAKRPMTYSLNGTSFQLQPGREIDLQRNQQWTVNFSAGKNLSNRAVKIDQPGRYVFRQTDQGWNLVREGARKVSKPVLGAGRQNKINEVAPSDLKPFPWTRQGSFGNKPPQRKASEGQSEKRKQIKKPPVEELPAPKKSSKRELKSVLEKSSDSDKNGRGK